MFRLLCPGVEDSRLELSVSKPEKALSFELKHTRIVKIHFHDGIAYYGAKGDVRVGIRPELRTRATSTPSQWI